MVLAASANPIWKETELYESAQAYPAVLACPDDYVRADISCWYRKDVKGPVSDCSSFKFLYNASTTGSKADDNSTTGLQRCFSFNAAGTATSGVLTLPLPGVCGTLSVAHDGWGARAAHWVHHVAV